MSKDDLKLRLLNKVQYRGINQDDPLRFYYWPIIGKMYRGRVEMCLNECHGGDSILEIGFGSGITFLNLNDLYDNIYGLDLTVCVSEVKSVFESLDIKTHLQNGNVLEMPYDDNVFDTVLLISILEHLKPIELAKAFSEIKRVLKPGGQVVYGVPVERPLMVFMFKVIGTNIREHHFSTEIDVYNAASKIFEEKAIKIMLGPFGLFGQVYEIGHFRVNK